MQEVTSSSMTTQLCVVAARPGKGFGLYATRDILPGEIIFAEDVLESSTIVTDVMGISKAWGLVFDLVTDPPTDPPAFFHNLCVNKELAKQQLNSPLNQQILRRMMRDFRGQNIVLIFSKIVTNFFVTESCFSWIGNSCCYINHGSVPNSAPTMHIPLDGKITFIATKYIAYGEEILMDYDAAGWIKMQERP